MSSKNNVYPALDNQRQMGDSPPQYGDIASATAPTMIPLEGPTTQSTSPPIHLQPAVIVGQQPPVYIVQNEVPVVNQLGSVPTMATCPSCHARQVSTVKYDASTKTHLFALGICLVGGCCCACIPYCVDSCQSAQHSCSSCGAYLGSYQN
ncbi:lipopolysaccharide-induced tumor necrosis factor-alpha factor-like [Drosophila tropicalis]|uniref:lipopolysaccharide-induced tumor necrosis factor-alpha factor-like n=1 Tax=Drosophila tropicalis TaxID=46794 RepID=UPI0035AC21BC